MNTSKIIKGVVGGGRYTVTAPIIKEDYGLYLQIEGIELPATYEVDFSNDEHSGTSVTMIGNADGVLIPNQFISSGKDVFAFLYHVGADYGRTVYKFRIPNKLRPDRTDEEPTPEQASTIDQAIVALNTAVAQTAQDVIDADASAQSAAESAESASASATASANSASVSAQSATDAQTYATQASQSAQASAQSASQSAQIKADVEGMVDDAQESATASANSASASAQSATRASESAQSASTSASTASSKASEAQGYAQTASSKASEASQSAQTASTKASESAQSATDAQTYATQAGQSATASAQSASQSAQIKADVEGVVDDAQGYANSASQSAQASANSASQAQGYAQSASTSAQSASGYASNAQESANTASSKASEASQSAQTASQKATESAQSASQALAYKTDAESAKTASQTAQGLAESARNTAVQAKNDAESARDEAQDIVDGISGKVEQIDSNTERIESLEDDRYKPYVTDSASGSIASFPDGTDDIPLKSLVVDINPVQDLHGQDSPYPAGGGKNLCSDIVSDYTKPSNYWVWHRTLEDGTYYINVTAKSGAETGYALVVAKSGDAYAEFVDPITILATKGTIYNKSFTVDSTWTNPVIGIYCPRDKTVSDFFANYTVQLEKNATPTDYAPYENICPISGWTQVNVNHSDADMTNPITITIDLGQTVYGGKLDVLSGVLTVDGTMVDLGTLDWVYTGEIFYSASAPLFGRNGTALLSNTARNVCEIYKYATVTINNPVNGRFFVSNIQEVPVLRVSDNRFTDAISLKSALDGIKAVLKLYTPLTIQLTPQQVNSLLGANNIWADTGDSEVEYRADTKLYIEKLTQPEEDDMVADSAITSGQFFMVGNSLYRAITNIASGATITVGTNAQRVSLADALNLVNA